MAYTGVYGSVFNDRDVLGIADVHKIHAIYEGVGGVLESPNATLDEESEFPNCMKKSKVRHQMHVLS